ncbi:MAG: SDR family oxidoreductase [Labilithrix sp.]|nr:SDR family oxidoreductase [Labilithrix sp.]MBX3222233.1 SDR family oxidoreductase [Labilithrix sp.]
MTTDSPAKTVVVTGVTRGIGKAVAERLIGKGHRIVGLARSKDELDALAAAHPDRLLPFVCDVRDGARVKEVIQEAVAKVGTVDAVVNNAGLLKFSATHDLADADLLAQVETILLGTIYVTRALLPTFIAQQRGLVVNLGSVSGQKASPKMAAYGAAKAGVENFTKSIALEYADKNIRAITICPGTIETTLMDKMMFAMIGKKVPMKRIGQPKEVAGLVEFLLSDDAAYMTGASVVIDGGVGL